MASERAETLLVLLRIGCLVSSAAAFAVVVMSPAWYTPFIYLMFTMLTQMTWSSARLYNQVLCRWFGNPRPRDNIVRLIVIEWVLMLATFGTAWSAVAVAVYLRRDSGLCSRGGFAPKVCPRYEAAELALVAGYLSLAIAVGMLWVEGSRHRTN